MKDIEEGAAGTGSADTGGPIDEGQGGEAPGAADAQAQAQAAKVEIATTSEAVATLLAAGQPFVKKADPASADPYLGFDISRLPRRRGDERVVGEQPALLHRLLSRARAESL